jgi:hypothetical protein
MARFVVVSALVVWLTTMGSTTQAVELESGVTTVSLTGDSTYSFVFGSRHINMLRDYPRLEITGTITNWNAYIDANNAPYDGLWSSIGMYGTDNWSNPSVAPTGLSGWAHLGDTSYGNIAHQLGFAQNASLAPVGVGSSATGGVVFAKMEDYFSEVPPATTPGWEGSQNSDPIAIDKNSKLHFKIDYDLTNTSNMTMTGSLSTDNVTWVSATTRIGLANNGVTPDNYSDTVFSVLAFDTTPSGASYSGGGYSVAWQVNSVPEPGTFALFAAGLVSLVVYAWRKRK